MIYPVSLNPLDDSRPTGLPDIPWCLASVLTYTNVAFKYHVLDISDFQLFFLVIQITGPYEWWSCACDIQDLINKEEFDITTHIYGKDHAANFIIQVSTPSMMHFCPFTT